jgi:hypothetical protein
MSDTATLVGPIRRVDVYQGFFIGFLFLGQIMRTYDKLIEAITKCRKPGGLRLPSGKSVQEKKQLS